VDPATNTVIATYRLDDPPQNLTFGYDALWVDAYEASKVWRIEPERLWRVLMGIRATTLSDPGST